MRRWIPIGVVAGMLSACGQPAPAIVDGGEFRYQTVAFDDSTGRPEALFEGKLALDDTTCVYGVATYQGVTEETSLVFPEGTSVIPGGEGLLLSSGEELVFDRPVDLGGGYTESESPTPSDRSQAGSSDDAEGAACTDHESAFTINPEQ